MSIPSAGSLSGFLRQVLRNWPQDERSDDELLTAFCRVREERAFAALVARYGLLVWGVCRRTLHHTQDAEDAFQAAFLVLAQKAGQIGARERMSNWLYGVARRTAWDLRKSVLRRQRHEQQVPDVPPVTYPQGRADAEVLAELDEQIAQLPRRYREALLLCRLAGKTYAEAARELECSVDAIKYRLTRAEHMLREQLGRRGLVLSGGTLPAALSQVTEVSAIPARLSGETVRAALAFVNHTLAPNRVVWIAQGVMQSMGSTKTLMWGVTLTALLCLGGAGMGLVAQPVPSAQKRGTVTAPAELQAPATPGEPRLDYHGDPLPQGALARIGTLRFRPDKWTGICDAAFLPDGKTLVSVHGTDIVHFWDVATGKERRRLQIPGIQQVGHVCISADGRLLAINGLEKEANTPEVRVWDLTADPPRPHAKHQAQGQIFTLALSSDGKTIAYGNVIQEGENQLRKIRLLDAKTGEQRQTLESACTQAGGLVFSPDGKFLAEWEQTGEEAKDIVCLWDLATGKSRHTFTSTLGHVYFTGFSPDSRTMATLHAKGIGVWDLATGKEKWHIATEKHNITQSVAFLPDGTLLETFRADGPVARLRLRDPDTGKQRRPEIEVPDLEAFGRPFPSPDGKLLAACGGKRIQVWNRETGKALGPQGIWDGRQEIAFSPNGETLATLSGGGGNRKSTVQLWQANTGAPGPRLKVDPHLPPSNYLDMAFGLNYAHDHRLYLFHNTRKPGPDGQIQSDTGLVGWDTQTGKKVEVPLSIRQATDKQKFNDLYRCAMSRDGRLVALPQGDDLALYELATGKEVRRLKGAAKIRRPVFSADGQSLAAYVGDQDQSLAVWNVATGRLLSSPAMSVRANSFALSSDGRWLAVYAFEEDDQGQTTRGVQMWEVASGRAGPRFQDEDTKRSNVMAFSPDRRTLAVGYADGTILLLEVSTGQKRHSLTGHRGAVVTLAFSADGLRLASGSEDTTALVWDMQRLQPPAPAGTERPKTEELLAALSRLDAAAAYRAMGQLAEVPGTAVAELRKRLQPPPPSDAKQVQVWLTDLDSKDFKARERAFAELAKQGDSVEGALHKALEERPPLEKRQRLEKLLELLQPSRNPARLIVFRGVEVLERIGTPEARKALEELAQLEGYLVGLEAQTALRRLSKLKAATP